jgi:mannose-6-phosphate isomerase-like protein (cupin superfamily)
MATRTFKAFPLATVTTRSLSRARAARAIGQPGPHIWLYVPQPEGLPGLDGYAAELGFATELPAAIAEYRGRWIEYGVVERTYALRCPDDFAAVVTRYGHTAIAPKQYTASAFLAGALGTLSRLGTVLYHLGPSDWPLVIQRHNQLFDEAIYLLRGRLLVASDDEPQEAAPGSIFVAPRRHRHSFSNPYAEDVWCWGSGGCQNPPSPSSATSAPPSCPMPRPTPNACVIFTPARQPPPPLT